MTEKDPTEELQETINKLEKMKSDIQALLKVAGLKIGKPIETFKKNDSEGSLFEGGIVYVKCNDPYQAKKLLDYLKQ
jgi:hypothetical protein